jgi:peptide/nickel transport system substrate-binding protein
MKQWTRATAVAALLLLASSAGTAAEKILRVNIVADPAMIDPITNSELVAGVVMKPMYEGFIAIDEKGSVVNALATSWNFSTDNKTITFRLRPGVKFHSGRMFGARDVKYTFEEVLRPGSRGGLVAPYLANIAGAKEFSDSKAQEVAGVRVVDPLTVEITLIKPDVLFPIYPFQFMDSGIGAEQGPDWMTEVSAGTGPFSFIRWQRGVEVAEKANPDYWGGAPKIDGIRFLIVPSGDTALSMYEANELDVVDVPESSYRRVLSDDRYAKEILKAPRAQMRYLGMNQALYPPFRDIRVREAISLAIDRAAMIKGLYVNAAVPLNGQVTPGVPGYGGDLPPLKYHPEQARKLLAEAGFPGGKGMPPIKVASTAPFKDELTYYANQLNRVLGMQVEVNVVERATHIKAMNAGEVAFFPWGWTADYPDAMTFLGDCWYSSSPYNRSRWKNAEYDAAIDQARSEADAEKRYALYHKAEQILMQDWATAPLPITTYVALRKPNVHGLLPTPFGWSSFQPVTMD